MRNMRFSRAGTLQLRVMRFCLRRISIDTLSPFSYDRRMRIACDGFAGFRPPIDVITSPPFKGKLESAGAFTTRMPSLLPKYSPKSGLRLTSSRLPHGIPNENSKCCMSGMSGGIPGIPGMPGMPGITLTFGAQPSSSATSVAFLASPPRRYSIDTVSPGSSLRASCTSFVPGPDSSSSSALSPASAVPLNLVMMSPTLSPAFAAGPPGVTPSTFAPSLSASESGWLFTTTPIRPRLSSAKTKARGCRGGRGGRGGCCPSSHAGPMSATATAAMIHFLNIMNGFLRASQPNIGDAGDVRVDQLLHQGHPLLPEFDELVVAPLRRRPAQPGQLAVDDGNAVFQLGHQGGRSAAHDASRGVVALELVLQGRRLLLRPRQLGCADLPRPERREHDQPGDRRSGRESDATPAPHAAPALGDDRVADP